MIRIIRLGGKIISSLSAVAVFIFSEGAFIFTLTKVGPLWTFVLFSVPSLIICMIIYRILGKEAVQFKWILSLKKVLNAQEERIPEKWKKVAKSSKFFALVGSSIFSGVFIGTAFLYILTSDVRKAQLWIIWNVIIFFSFWTLFYSGVFTTIKLFFTK